MWDYLTKCKSVCFKQCWILSARILAHSQSLCSICVDLQLFCCCSRPNMSKRVDVLVNFRIARRAAAVAVCAFVGESTTESRFRGCSLRNLRVSQMWHRVPCCRIECSERFPFENSELVMYCLRACGVCALLCFAYGACLYHVWKASISLYARMRSTLPMGNLPFRYANTQHLYAANFTHICARISGPLCECA